jgi:hypothetical protein
VQLPLVSEGGGRYDLTMESKDVHSSSGLKESGLDGFEP